MPSARSASGHNRNRISASRTSRPPSRAPARRPTATPYRMNTKGAYGPTCYPLGPMSVTAPRTIVDKIWDEHVVDEEPGAPAVLAIDLHLVHEVTSPQAFSGLRARRL